MSEFQYGIPLNKAIIVRHTPNDERANDMVNHTGALSPELASKAIDYAARRGDHADKSDIDRAMTRDDYRLVADYQQRTKAGVGLDYISRVGVFEAKGADRQIDASLWNQYGPVDAKAIERDMIDSGGAFVDSFISVKREYGHQLGLETKQDFQRLMRNTWTDAVKEWEIIKNPTDIRWVAAFHSDANMSLHVHIYTWSAKGEIPVGYTVPKYQTRRAKAVILREGYASIRQIRDKRATFLRDLSVIEAKRQLGRPIEQRSINKINQRALANNWPERVSAKSDLTPEGREKVNGLVEKLKKELVDGHGRLSNNYKAQATSKDILRVLENSSTALKELSELRKEYARDKAFINGYSEHSDDFKQFVRQDLKEQEKRITNAIVRDYAPRQTQSIPLRRDLQLLDARAHDGRENISFNRKLIHELTSNTVRVRLPQISAQGTQRFVDIPLHETGVINRGQARLASLENDRSYPILDRHGTQIDTLTGKELTRAFGKADMNYIARLNPDEFLRADRAARKASFQERLYSKNHESRGQETSYLNKARKELNPSSNRYQNNLSLKHGISLDRSIRLSRDAQKLTKSLYQSGVKHYSQLNDNDKRIVERMARQVVNSKTNQQTLMTRARHEAKHSGRPAKDHLKELNQRALTTTRNLITSKAEKGELRTNEQTRAGLTLTDSLGTLAEALISDRNNNGSKKRFKSRSSQEHDQDRAR